MQQIATDIAIHPLPLTELIYGLLGLNFLQHRSEGFSRVSRNRVYLALKNLSDKYPKYFPRVFFTERGSLMHSKQVEDALFRLCGVVAVENPRYQYLGFNENELIHVEAKLKKWLTVENLKILEELAKEFYKELN
jgi:hypothetical protein